MATNDAVSRAATAPISWRIIRQWAAASFTSKGPVRPRVVDRLAVDVHEGSGPGARDSRDEVGQDRREGALMLVARGLRSAPPAAARGAHVLAPGRAMSVAARSETTPTTSQ